MTIIKKGEIVTAQTSGPVVIDDLFEKPDVSGHPVSFQSTNVAVIGDQATYKTKSLESIPQEIIIPRTGELDKARVLHIDADDRSSVIDRKKVPHFTFIRIPYDPTNNVKSWQYYNGLIDRLNAGEYNYNIGILDTLSPLNMTLWDLSWEEPPIGVGTLRKDRKGNEYNASKYTTDYGNGADMNYEFVKREMRRILFSLARRFDYFICIAHLKSPFHMDEGTAKEKFTADLVGGMKDILPRMFQEVYFTVRSADNSWVWLTAPPQSGPHRKKFARTCLPIPMYVPQDFSIITNNNWQKYVDTPVTAEKEEVI